jgi:drug/metabolite transporter (DMT)-like permease
MAITSWTAWPGAALALASAALFGASTPLAKALLGGGFSPWLLAAILYLGSGLGLAAIAAGRRLFGGSRREAPLAGADWGWMALIVLSGGVAGPVLLMIGLTTTPASSAALLLNLEGLATMAIAWAVFRENVDRRLLVGACAILAGALLLSWQGPGFRTDGGAGLGVLAIAGACLAWGIDNNLTRKVSGVDPLQIATIKGLAAGIVNLALAVWLGARLPGLPILAGAALVGFLGYGVSLVLFVLALRHLGTARTGAYFSMAPFIGAVIALGPFGEPVTARLVAAGVLMAIGLWFHLAERHAHEHEHAPLEHSHAHVHDAHHQHEHGAGEPARDNRSGEPHVHAHCHTRLVHSHPHYPDLHHRHEH